ncbi:DUF6163 family protein [Acuticoccus mangrovi]|uniref:Uncharacterized protein n=1 Tax=Acuticoccus mangrovi TaxID=2796142 RepID=A0A934MJD5_9HYPH|nr:DUF6163 family protein [Acuticoccus mangrovi]MBJ3778181.1 hypothetical protein [Acuticoccus mangrovi]
MSSDTPKGDPAKPKGAAAEIKGASAKEKGGSAKEKGGGPQGEAVREKSEAGKAGRAAAGATPRPAKPPARKPAPTEAAKGEASAPAKVPAPSASGPRAERDRGTLQPSGPVKGGSVAKSGALVRASGSEKTGATGRPAGTPREVKAEAVAPAEQALASPAKPTPPANLPAVVAPAPPQPTPAAPAAAAAAPSRPVKPPKASRKKEAGDTTLRRNPRAANFSAMSLDTPLAQREERPEPLRAVTAIIMKVAGIAWLAGAIIIWGRLVGYLESSLNPGWHAADGPWLTTIVAAVAYPVVSIGLWLGGSWGVVVWAAAIGAGVALAVLNPMLLPFGPAALLSNLVVFLVVTSLGALMAWRRRADELD